MNDDETLKDLLARQQKIYAENALLRAVLQELLDLDAKRPVDTTWWQKWWDETRAKARILLGMAG